MQFVYKPHDQIPHSKYYIFYLRTACVLSLVCHHSSQLHKVLLLTIVCRLSARCSLSSPQPPSAKMLMRNYCLPQNFRVPFRHMKRKTKSSLPLFQLTEWMLSIRRLHSNARQCYTMYVEWAPQEAKWNSHQIARIREMNSTGDVLCKVCTVHWE